MQTIQVEMLTLNGDALFRVNDATLAQIWQKQHDYLSELKRNIHPYGCRQDYHDTFDEAVNFIKENITSYFSYVGVPVKFIAK